MLCVYIHVHVHVHGNGYFYIKTQPPTSTHTHTHTQIYNKIHFHSQFAYRFIHVGFFVAIRSRDVRDQRAFVPSDQDSACACRGCWVDHISHIHPASLGTITQALCIPIIPWFGFVYGVGFIMGDFFQTNDVKCTAKVAQMRCNNHKMTDMKLYTFTSIHLYMYIHVHVCLCVYM